LTETLAPAAADARRSRREAAGDGARSATRAAARPKPGAWDTLSLVFSAGGPGFCQFAVCNACNANCGFCNFARDRLPREEWNFVESGKALAALDILFREGVRYLVLTGGEPTLHPDLAAIVAHGASLGMKVMVVTNAGLLKPEKIHELANAGISSIIISVDAASQERHEDNRGLPGVCERIREATGIIAGLKLHATASVTMSRLVDYEALPEFLTRLGFTSVVFSYPLTYLPGFFLGYADSPLVTYTDAELLAAYDKVKALKKRFRVVNPTLSLEEMQRFVRKEEQKYGCLAGYRYFFLDWNLMLWRCHHWEEPMCSVFEFDSSKLIRDNCTRCMINCYRDSSLMQHVAVSVHDAYAAVKQGRIGDGVGHLLKRTNLDSLKAVAEEFSWIQRF
jgi:MoaA/NifB/PqqE/SkfB family radical SAM enzyme